MQGTTILRSLVMGAAIGLGGLLAPSRLRVPDPIPAVQPRGKGKGSAPIGALRRAVREGARLLDSGFWRLTRTESRNRKGTPAQQAARIFAATERRARRAIVADRNIWRSYMGNPCLDCSNRANPTFVNR